MDQQLLGEEIKLLAQLKNDKVITQDQFARATKKILTKMSRRPGVPISNEILWSFAGKITLLFVVLIFGLVAWGALQIYRQNAELAKLDNRTQKRDNIVMANVPDVKTLQIEMGKVQAQIDELFDALQKE